MNLARFHAAIVEIRFAFDVEKIVELLTALPGHLQQSVSQQTPETAKAFKDQYALLMQTLEDSRLNIAFPTRRMIFEDLGAIPLIGRGLMERVEAIFSENRVTPANALIELKKINAEVSGFYKTIKAIEESFSALGVEYDDLEVGQFEVGFSFPRDVVGHSLEALGDEFSQMDYALRTFQEISGEGGGSPNIKTISASEWQVFLDALCLEGVRNFV